LAHKEAHFMRTVGPQSGIHKLNLKKKWLIGILPANLR
jgi:hypothetical protein